MSSSTSTGQTTSKSAHSRAAHSIRTARLLIRSAVHADAEAIYNVLSSPANHPHTMVEPNLSTAVFEQRIAKWTATTAQGKNAFMVIVLLSSSSPSTQGLDSSGMAQNVSKDTNRNGDDNDGKIIGFTGFNAFAKSPSLSDPTRTVLTADTGVLIDHTHWRHGYGAEALRALLDYGFNELDCDVITAGTGIDNTPWRSMMNASLGLGSWETREIFPCGPDAVQDSWVWRVDKEEWRRMIKKDEK